MSPLKRYLIRVRGFDAYEVTARSAGAARYANYRAWREAGYGRRYPGSVAFKEFLTTEIEAFYHLGSAKGEQG